MDTSEYYGGLYPEPPEEIEEEEYIYDEDYYYEENRLEELENGIHVGLNTHIQLQLITLTSFNTINTICNTPIKPIPLLTYS